MNKLIVAAFPASAIKFMVQSDIEQVDSQKMCWFPEFKSYIPEVVSKIKGLTTLPVIEEGI